MQLQLIKHLAKAMLKHQPQRHGLMESLETHQRTGRKYIERSSIPNDQLLTAHIAGHSTLAVPAQANGLAATIVFDCDSDAFNTVPMILNEARLMGLWAWGEVNEKLQRGYAYIPFSTLCNAQALKQLGDRIVKDIRAEIDNRTANASITRLPFGVHQWTNSRGLVIFQDGEFTDPNTDLEKSLCMWIERYIENNTDLVIVEQKQSTAVPNYKKPLDLNQLRTTFNNSFDIANILLQNHAKQHSRTLWHCPCGNHKNGDISPSLLIRPAKKPRYGSFIVQGYSPVCKFYSANREVWDAFNVDMTLNGRSISEQIKHAQQQLGITNTAHPTPTQKKPTKPTTPAQPAPDQAQQYQGQTIDPNQSKQIQQLILIHAATDHGLRPSARKILHALIEAADSRLWTRKSIATFGKITGLARRTVQYALRELEEKQYIKTDHTGNQHGGDETNIYTLCAPCNHNAPKLKQITCKGGGSYAPPAAAEPAPAQSAAEPIAELAPIQPAAEPAPAQSAAEPIAEPAPAQPAAEPAPAQPAAEPIAELAPIQPAAEPIAEPAPTQFIVAVPIDSVSVKSIKILRPRKVIRTIDDLSIEEQNPPSVSNNINLEPPQEIESNELDGAFFDESVYLEWSQRPADYSGIPYTKDHDQLMKIHNQKRQSQSSNFVPSTPIPTADIGDQTQFSLTTDSEPTYTKNDQLAVIRDIVDRLRAEAIKTGSKHCWAMYHRERNRLTSMERMITNRPAQPTQPEQKKRRKKSPKQMGLGTTSS